MVLGPSVASLRPRGIRSADVALAGLRQAASSSLKKTLRGVRAAAPVQAARLGRGSRSARFGPPLVVSLGAADPTSRRAISAVAGQQGHIFRLGSRGRLHPSQYIRPNCGGEVSLRILLRELDWRTARK